MVRVPRGGGQEALVLKASPERDGDMETFAGNEALALHLVMAADEDHLAWRREHLSEVHTIANTGALVRETLDVLRGASERASL